MIQEFVDRFMAKKTALRQVFSKLKAVITALASDENQGINPEAIHSFRAGDCYQGNRLYVIAEKGTYPEEFWYVKVKYGSCSSCDTLKRIRDEGPKDALPTDHQVAAYMMLALHIVQGLKELGGESVEG